MDKKRQNSVLEVLNYWKTIEFLNQKDIIEDSVDNKKRIDKIKKGEKVSAGKIEVLTEIVELIQVDKILEQDYKNYLDFPIIGNEICFCLGSIDRNSIVEYLSKYIEDEQELPELAYPKKSAIAWCSFKTDAEGLYINNSFQLSPLLWAISVWEKYRADMSRDFYLNIDDYSKIIEKNNNELEGQNVSIFMTCIYKWIYYAYVVNPFPKVEISSMGFFEYNRYINNEEKEKDDVPTDYTDFGKSFFISDIVLFEDAVRDEKFGDDTLYQKSVLDYILSAYEKSKGMGNMIRTIISPKESRERMFDFFNTILNVKNAPIGKWPAKFMPALMQQVAVNIAIDKGERTPIFSVNGPPGTGKTTLLKEIVSNNIVERAILLADEAVDDPDTAFERVYFKQGPLQESNNAYAKFAPAYYKLKQDKINDYGMLVASCNNAAVENITADLPKSADILDSLKSSDSDDDVIKNGLEQIHALFDIEQSEDVETITLYKKSREEKDIYFTRYANKLFDTDNCWGLVSAPLGKRSNIKKYCFNVLKPFIEEYKLNDSREQHRKKYVKQREMFLQQLHLVRELKCELEAVCDNGHMPDRNTDKENRITKTAYGYIISDEFSIDPVCSKVNLPEKFTVGEHKLTPIDTLFMDRYMSLDEKEATKAQVANPWFTARYNREREKLFLYACKLHKEFVASSKSIRQNFINLLIAWNMYDEDTERMTQDDRNEAFPVLLQSVFLLTPVISTTFASAQVFLNDIKKSDMLGTLIVDEAGQAQPQMTIGSLFRCRKAIIVGDPKQIEPVVTAETDMFKQLLSSKVLTSYKDKKISVQGFADYINPFGTFLGEEEEKEWVGCPLVVHRRCIDPMYTISNVLSYDGTMKQQTGAPNAKREATLVLDKSYWINVKGNEAPGNKNHFVPAQGELVLKLLEEKLKKDDGEIPKLFIISPFTSVKAGMVTLIKKSSLFKEEPRVKKWLDENNIGTVHTFQGQGTDEVIFLLGCDQSSAGAANWVNKNIVNVAATRAKFRFYVIGDKDVWTCKPVKIARETIAEELSADDLFEMLSPKESEENKDITTIEKTIIVNDPITENQLEEKIKSFEENALETCPECGMVLIERTGPYGKFVSCSGFPKCRYRPTKK